MQTFIYMNVHIYVVFNHWQNQVMVDSKHRKKGDPFVCVIILCWICCHMYTYYIYIVTSSWYFWIQCFRQEEFFRVRCYCTLRMSTHIGILYSKNNEFVTFFRVCCYCILRISTHVGISYSKNNEFVTFLTPKHREKEILSCVLLFCVETIDIFT